MAEEIEIINVGDGGVASEATLKALVAAVNAMGGGGSSKGAKVQEMHNKAVQSGIKVSTKNRDALKKNTKSVKNSTKAVSEFANKLKGSILGGLGAVASGLIGFGAELIAGGDQFSDFTKHIPLVGGPLSMLAGIVDNSVSAFREMSSVGASFGNDIEAMRRAAATSGMSLDEFKGFISENSETIRLFGSTVTSGANGFLALNKEMKKTGKFTELKELGFSVMEINEGLSGYAALQSRLGRLQGQSTTELANGASGYLKQLDRLAKVTGKSREELESQMAAQAADAGFRAIQNSLTGEAAENFRASMTLVSSIGGSTATALQDLADGVPQTEEAIALVNAAGPGIIDVMQQVANGADPQILIDALGEAGGAIEGFAGATGQERAAMIANLRESNPALAAILDEATKLTELGSQSYDDAVAEQSKREAISQSLTTFDDKVREIRASIATALIDSGIFATLSGAFAGAADMLKTTLGSDEFKSSIQEFADKIKAFLTDIQNVGFVDAVKNLFKDIDFGQMVKDFLFGTLFGSSDSESNEAASAETPGDSGGGGGSSDPTGIGGVMAAVQEKLGGFATMIAAGGVVYAAIKGLQVLIGGFGTGPVAAGALVFTGMLIGTGASIKLAGDGISAAGDGIKKVAEGIERMAGMGDTANFENIAGALGKIGPALISLTAGGVLDSITSFFGADSPFEKLRDGINEFGGIEPTAIANLKTAGEGLSTFTTISDNLDAGPVTRYAEAVETLAESMEKLNEALADKNNSWGESGMSVGNMLANGQTLGGGSGMSEEQINQLNTTMLQAVAALTDIKQINTRQLAALNDMGDVY